MDMFMHRLVRQGLWLGVAAAMAVTVVGCNSTTTTTEAVTVAEDTSSTGQAAKVEATSSSASVGETDAQASASDAPQVSHADPFSEDSVQALEAMLRPLEAIPVETQATVSRDG